MNKYDKNEHFVPDRYLPLMYIFFAGIVLFFVLVWASNWQTKYEYEFKHQRCLEMFALEGNIEVSEMNKRFHAKCMLIINSAKHN